MARNHFDPERLRKIWELYKNGAEEIEIMNSVGIKPYEFKIYKSCIQECVNTLLIDEVMDRHGIKGHPILKT